MRLHSEHPDPATHVIRVVGDLEGPEVLALANAHEATEPPPRCRVVDLTEMTFIDSAGVRALLELASATTAAGGEIVLVIGHDAYARHLLEVRGVIGRFRVVATRAEAVAR